MRTPYSPIPDPKRIVRDGYDACAAAYDAARSRDPGPDVRRLLSLLPEGAKVLDIGCGAGLPVTAALAGKCRVTGIDLSRAQIELARPRLPAARLLHADIMAQAFRPGSFDAVVAFYALFHVPRDEHARLFESIARWLRPGGLLMVTLAEHDEPGSSEPDFFGASMYWSHFSFEFYERRLRALGFAVEPPVVAEHGYRPELGMPPERHLLVLARRGPPAATGGREP